MDINEVVAADIYVVADVSFLFLNVCDMKIIDKKHRTSLASITRWCRSEKRQRRARHEATTKGNGRV